MVMSMFKCIIQELMMANITKAVQFNWSTILLRSIVICLAEPQMRGWQSSTKNRSRYLEERTPSRSWTDGAEPSKNKEKSS